MFSTMARCVIIALVLIVLLPLTQGMLTMHARTRIYCKENFVPAVFLRGMPGLTATLVTGLYRTAKGNSSSGTQWNNKLLLHLRSSTDLHQQLGAHL